MPRRRWIIIAATLALMPDDWSVVENLVAPVITNSETTNVERLPDRICYDWRLTKRRSPRQLFFVFFATGAAPENSDRTMLDACVEDGGTCRPLRSGKTSPAGAPTSRRLCFILPDYLARDHAVTIDGFVVYQGDAWWRMVYKIGPVTAELDGAQSPP